MLVSYLDIRDRFLARLPDEEQNRRDTLDIYVSVGRFVVDRWLAEEIDRPDGGQLNEQASWGRWDQCTEKHLRDLRSEAVGMLNVEVQKGPVFGFVRAAFQRLDALKTFAVVVAWTAKEAVRGFVGAIGLLIFGLLLVWLAPHVAKVLRSTADDALPADTRPADEAGNHG
ncbi:MAG: hypothetical protein JWQ16_3473 [Novosphingobium sp.]|nr:hypothetical protein [Novosphingobium sp.]